VRTAGEGVTRREVLGQIRENVIRNRSSGSVGGLGGGDGSGVDNLTHEGGACSRETTSNTTAVDGGDVDGQGSWAENEVVTAIALLNDGGRTSIWQVDALDDNVAVTVQSVVGARRVGTAGHTLVVRFAEEGCVANGGDASCSGSRVDEVDFGLEWRAVRVL
jgi:hypothetical protein